MQKLLARFGFAQWQDVERKMIFEGTVQSILIQTLSIALVFTGNVLLARRAGADAYGKYVHIFNWISLLAVIAVTGRDDLVLADLPKYRSSGETWRMGKLIKRTNRHVFGAAMGVSLFFLAVVWFLPIPTLHEYRVEFLIGMGALYFSAFLTLNQYILQALDRIRLSQVVEKLLKPFLLILFFIVALAMGFEPRSRVLILLMETSMGVCACVLAILIAREVKKYPRQEDPSKEGNAIDKRTFYFFLITLMALLVTKLTMFILPYFAPRSDIGIFSVSYRFADLIVYPFFLMHTVLPQLFARHTASEKEHKQSLYSHSTRLMTILSLPLLIVIILAGRYLLGWFGTAFVAGYPALLLISASQFLYSFFGPANTILMMQNREKRSAFCLLVYVLLLAGTSILLIPIWGITGGGLALFLSCLAYNIILSFSAYRLNGVVSPFLLFFLPRKN